MSFLITRKFLIYNPNKATILVVDDDIVISNLLAKDLAQEGYSCATVANGEDALKRLCGEGFNAVLLGLNLPGISSMEVLREMQSTCPETVVIIITAATDAHSAVKAMKCGAFDFITKPFNLDEVNLCIETALKPDAAVSRNSIIWSRNSDKDWMSCIENISRGVRERLDSLNGHFITKMVIEKTKAVAENMDIPDNFIQSWAADELNRTKRSHALNSMLEKLPIC